MKLTGAQILMEVLKEEGVDSIFGFPGGATIDIHDHLETTDIPMDAWGEEFIYEPYPESGKSFVIISYGADKEEDGEDYDADLYSTDAY